MGLCKHGGVVVTKDNSGAREGSIDKYAIQQVKVAVVNYFFLYEIREAENKTNA